MSETERMMKVPARWVELLTWVVDTAAEQPGQDAEGNPARWQITLNVHGHQVVAEFRQVGEEQDAFGRVVRVERRRLHRMSLAPPDAQRVIRRG